MHLTLRDYFAADRPFWFSLTRGVVAYSVSTFPAMLITSVYDFISVNHFCLKLLLLGLVAVCDVDSRMLLCFRVANYNWE